MSASQVEKSCVNADIQAYLAQCDSQVLAHPALNSLQKEKPTSKCGHLAYDTKIASERISQGVDYVADCTA